MNQPTDATRSRLKSEAAFHDARIAVTDEHRLGYVYRSVADVYTFCNVPQAAFAASVLELGCFRGDEAAMLEGFSGHYVGIDISPAAIEHCRSLGLPDNFAFRVDDANTLGTIDDGSVDYAFGNGVLHHLDLSRFAPALARKLTRSGRARFIEPAQGSLPLRLFRAMTPRLRTPDEFPFDRAAIQLLRQHFNVDVTYKALLRPFVPMLFLNSMVVTRAASWGDDHLLRIPMLQDQAWLLQIELTPHLSNR